MNGLVSRNLLVASYLEAKRHFEKMPVHESFGVPRGSKWPENGPKMGLFRGKTGLFRYESSTTQLFQMKLLATKKPAFRDGAGRRVTVLGPVGFEPTTKGL